MTPADEAQVRPGSRATQTATRRPTYAGSWRAELPGEWTANDSGLSLQYYLTTQDAMATDLVSMGGPDSPLLVQVTAGDRAGNTGTWRTTISIP